MAELKVSSGVYTSVTAKLDEFPFRAEFSLVPLIRYWERDLAADDGTFGAAARHGGGSAPVRSTIMR